MMLSRIWSNLRNAQQPQDAATQSAQQSPGATSQDLGPTSELYSPGYTIYIEFQGISAQEVDEVLDATTQSAQQSPDAAHTGYTEVSVYCYPDVGEFLDASSECTTIEPR
ncbi:hypothetical protein BASA62_006805 [Batrachochytrium salamandrivorans]|nr:hypothetical protein BASA62_006805 [Batrachochytrium salamandrivorans]